MHVGNTSEKHFYWRTFLWFAVLFVALFLTGNEKILLWIFSFSQGVISAQQRDVIETAKCQTEIKGTGKLP